MSKCPAAGQGLEWTKCPPVRNFHRISTERLFQISDDIWCFLRNVERFQKLCSFVRRRNNRACAYYEIGICLTLRKFTLTSAVRDIYRIATKSSGRIIQACVYHKIALMVFNWGDPKSRNDGTAEWRNGGITERRPKITPNPKRRNGGVTERQKIPPNPKRRNRGITERRKITQILKDGMTENHPKS